MQTLLGPPSALPPFLWLPTPRPSPSYPLPAALPALPAPQLIRGMDKTVEHLVGELKKLAKDVTDEELKDVATVSAGGNENVRAGG